MVVTTSGDSNGGVGVGGDGSICPEKENMVVQYIATRVMLYLCEETVWGPREWVHMIWWEQDLLLHPPHPPLHALGPVNPVPTISYES